MAAGAVRVFGVQAVLLLQMPDGQVSRTSASPQRPDPVRRGGPPALADRVAAHVLGDGQASAVVSLSAEEWLRLMPDSTLREEVCLAAARTKPDRPLEHLAPAVLAVFADRRTAGPPWRSRRAALRCRSKWVPAAL